MSDRTVEILGTFPIGGANLLATKTSYTYTRYDGAVIPYGYTGYEVEGEGLERLNNMRIMLEALHKDPEDTMYGPEHDLETRAYMIDMLEEMAADVAEGLEISFIYDADGDKREYTPQSNWQASGSCEWEESAQQGYDYGWNI